MPTYKYHTNVTWKGEHWGHLVCGNGPEMDFSAPPDAQGHAGVLTPEDAFVAAANSCIMLMFIWACERFKLDLVSYDCYCEGEKVIALDRTETFTRLTLKPRIVVRRNDEEQDILERRVERAWRSAQKYSLVVNSVKSEVVVESETRIV
jgi:organic hydroperoxide reductase OsmC/OhrA